MNAGSLLCLMAAMVVCAPSALGAQPAATAQPAAPTRATDARGLLDEPRPLTKGLDFGAKFLGGDESGERKSGVFPEMGNMVTGAGWISAGVGYRHFFGDRVMVEASTGLSWRAYKMAQARVELTPFGDDRVAVGAQTRWQDLTQVNYFGNGPDTLESLRSQYRMKTTDTVGYATVRPRRWLALHARAGMLSGPELSAPGGAFKRDLPSTFDVFPADAVFQLAEQPDFLHSELAVVADTRDEPGYPLRGGVYRVAWSRYDDRGADWFAFDRYEAEAAHFMPLRTTNVILGVRGWLAGTAADERHHVPFYLAPSLGGSNTLRGYHDYRFHDRSVALVNTEVRVAVFQHVDLVGLWEAGNVAPRVGDLNLDKRSYGVGVRVHSDRATFARLDFAWSDESMQVVFRLNDPFRLSRFNKRTAQIPFAP
jgi:hypothetical protein